MISSYVESYVELRLIPGERFVKGTRASYHILHSYKCQTFFVSLRPACLPACLRHI